MQTERPYAYSYVRMSTNIQLKGDSLRRQKDASQRYAELNNLKLIDDFKLEDIGVSAFTGANVETGCLGVFLEHVKTNKIDPLVAKIDGAIVGRLEPGNQTQESGLAATGGSQQRGKRPCGEIDGDISESNRLAEALGQILDVNVGHAPLLQCFSIDRGAALSARP